MNGWRMQCGFSSIWAISFAKTEDNLPIINGLSISLEKEIIVRDFGLLITITI